MNNGVNNADALNVGYRLIDTAQAYRNEGLAVITTKMNGEDIDKKFPQIDAWLEKVNLK